MLGISVTRMEDARNVSAVPHGQNYKMAAGLQENQGGFGEPLVSISNLPATVSLLPL
jgi:hypothetical protein